MSTVGRTLSTALGKGTTGKGGEELFRTKTTPFQSPWTRKAAPEMGEGKIFNARESSADD